MNSCYKSKSMLINNLEFDVKNLGVNIVFPFLMCIVSCIFLRAYLNDPQKWMHILEISETFVPMSAGWISIFLFVDIIQEGGYEVIFTYPVKRKELGIKRVLIFYVVYAISVLLYVLSIQLITKENVWLNLYVQFLIEGLFFSALGFLSIVLTSNCAFSIVILVGYSIIGTLTKGKHLGILNIFFSNFDVLGIKEVLIYGIKPLVYSFVLFWVAQFKFNKIN